MFTLPSFVKPLLNTYDKAISLTQDVNRSTIKLLLSIVKPYIFSCFSFAFVQLHTGIPRSMRLPHTPTTRSDFNPFVVCHLT